MKKLEVIKVNNYIYYMNDEYGENYILNIEFLDIEETPQVGDYIYMHKELLDAKYEGYNTSYTFGNLENMYGKLRNKKR